MKVILKQDVDKLGKTGDDRQGGPGLRPEFPDSDEDRHRGHPGQREDHGNRKAGPRPARPARQDGRQPAGHATSSSWSSRSRRKAGEEGALYGSVTAIDIADFLVTHKIDIDKRKIQLEDPIKTVGEYQVPIRLHREVTVPIRVVVEAEPESAE